MNKKKFAVIVISVILVIGSAISGMLLAKFAATPFNMERGATVDPVEPGLKGKVKFNTLILGLDGDKTRSDVMLLVSFDGVLNKLNVMSIPRDTKVKYGNNTGLINAAYGTPVKQKDGSTKQGGIDYTIKKVKELTGIPISYYVVFTFGDFKNVIDAIDGVDFYVPQRMKYSDPWQALYIDLYEGQQHLDGDKAEQLVRFRQYPLGDLQRVEVQQKFLRAIIYQKLNARYLTKLPNVYYAVKDTVLSNFSLDDMVDYGKKMLDIDWENDIYTCTLPTTHDGSHLQPDKEKIDEVVETVFGYNGPISDNEPYPTEEVVEP